MRPSSSSNSEPATVTVEFVGTLRHFAGKRKLEITLAGSAKLISLIRELEEKHGIPKGTLLGANGEEMRRDLLVLVNGREIGVLDGIATLLSGGDRLTLLPVSHGG